MNFKHLFFIGLLLCTGVRATAQNNSTMYFMQELPLVNSLNPAFQPQNGTVYVSIPVLSSLYFNATSSFQGLNFKNLEQGIPLYEIVNSPGAVQNGQANLELNLFNLGILVNDLYFTLDINFKVNSELSVPHSVLELAWKGNASHVGESVSLSGLGAKAEAYSEIGLGVSKKIKFDDGEWVVGGKVKYLMGFAMAEGSLNDGSFLYTSPDDYTLTLGLNPSMSIAGPQQNVPNAPFALDSFDIETSYDQFHIPGQGAAVDLGWKFTRRELTISGSLLNTGAIVWNKTAMRLRPVGGTIPLSFEGFEKNFNIDSALNGTSLAADAGFTQWLSPTLNLAAQYKLYKHLNVGAMMGFTMHEHYNTSLFALSASTSGLAINSCVTYSYFSNTHNVGLGLLFGRRGLQFHIITDNILAANYQTARGANIRFGLNLLLGRDPKTPKVALPVGVQVARQRKAQEEVRYNERSGDRWYHIFGNKRAEQSWENAGYVTY